MGLPDPVTGIVGRRLGWDDVNQEAALIRVRTTVLDVAGDHPCERCGLAHKRLLFDNPKSAAGERIYPLVPAISATLMEHRRRQDHDRELYGEVYADHGLVFAQPDGNPL